MMHPFKKIILPISLAVAFSLNTVSVSRSEVVVFDGVTTVHAPIRIKVLTRGRIFSEGGRRVDIYLDDNHLKRVLTGGDGYGYFKYIFQNPGIKEITARSDADSSTGLVLVMGRNEKAIIIDVEGAFKGALFSAKLRADSRKVVHALSKDYKVIYLSRFVGKGVSRSWLEKNDFPKSVILSWQGSSTFKSLDKNGVNLDTVIGSDTVISAAKNYIEHRYTFEKSKDGKLVKNWDEILKLLQPIPPAEQQQDRLPVKKNGVVPP